MNPIKLTISSLTLAVLAGCAGAPLEQEKAQATAQFITQIDQDTMVGNINPQSELAWWQQLNDPQLNRLVEQTLNRNQNLKVSAARLRASLAQLTDQQRSLWPQGSLDVTGVRGNATSTLNPNGKTSEYTTGLTNFSWQLDLSGRIDALSAAAEAAAQDQQGQYQNMAGELVSSTVRSYLQWQNQSLRLDLTHHQLQALEDSLAILQVQVQEGIATELELNRTKSQYFELKQQLPQVATEQAQVEQTLAVLLDKQAHELDLTPISAAQYDQLAIDVAVQSPVDALMNRGDVQSALARLTQQSQLAKSAERALYPDISLSAFAGVISAPGLNFNNTQSDWQVMPTLSWSLFSYPQLLAQLDAQTALSEANYHAYKQTLTQVLSTAEFSLRSLVQSKQQLTFAKARVNASQQAYRQANSEYQEGQLAYLDLLDARQDVLIAEQAQMTIRNQWLSAGVNVYSELSGQWSNALLASN
ncbi:TolC family protein [Amphritea opalescens]|uniref:TolC family protein n=1 Tax=Amphritea opalescens TaxID=2490544 RepID=A0A430KLD4_9GAMM|nr:TolC family protein [Amphritea opalescens]RTE64290.1 TolC family protein [Amphritea opalescens]